MVLELNHWSVINLIIAVVGLFVIIELTKFFPDLLHLWIVIILLNLPIFIINVATHSYASVDLHGSYSLSCQVAPDVSLNLNQQGHLPGGHPSTEAIGVVSFDISVLIHCFSRAAISHIFLSII